MDDNDDGPQTTRWSGVGPGRGRGHAPRAQGRHSPTAEYHACTIARLEATIDNYTRAIEQMDDDDDRPQTARWSGGGPGRGRRVAPQTDSHTASRDDQTRGGKVQEVQPPISISGRDTLEGGVMSGELPLTCMSYSLSPPFSLFPSLSPLFLTLSHYSLPSSL
jgi:hypothetical protein